MRVSVWYETSWLPLAVTRIPGITRFLFHGPSRGLTPRGFGSPGDHLVIVMTEGESFDFNIDHILGRYPRSVRCSTSRCERAPVSARGAKGAKGASESAAVQRLGIERRGRPLGRPATLPSTVSREPVLENFSAEQMRQCDFHLQGARRHARRREWKRVFSGRIKLLRCERSNSVNA